MAKLHLKRKATGHHKLYLDDSERHSLVMFLNIVQEQYPKALKQMTPIEAAEVINLHSILEAVPSRIDRAARRRSKHRRQQAKFKTVKG